LLARNTQSALEKRMVLLLLQEALA